MNQCHLWPRKNWMLQQSSQKKFLFVSCVYNNEFRLGCIETLGNSIRGSKYCFYSIVRKRHFKKFFVLFLKKKKKKIGSKEVYEFVKSNHGNNTILMEINSRVLDYKNGDFAWPESLKRPRLRSVDDTWVFSTTINGRYRVYDFVSNIILCTVRTYG